MDSLHFFQEAIEEMKRQGHTPFMDLVVERALHDVLRDTPNATALPSGQSILLELWDVSTRIACQWHDLRGPDAWAPTPNAPYPLAVFLSNANERYVDTLPDGYGGRTTLLEHVFESDTALNFLLSGIEHAMPLKQAQASNTTDNATFFAQRQVVDKLIEISKRAEFEPLKEIKSYALWESFRRHEGALVFLSDLQGRHVKPESPQWGPRDTIWWRPVLSDDAFKPFVWHELWAQQVDRDWEITKLLPWLKAHGVDTHDIEKRAVELKVESAALSSNTKPKERWARIFDTLNSSGWDQEGKDNRLLWQNALKIDSSLLPAMIDQPPPGGLAQKSSNGEGVWDVLTLSTLKLSRAQVGRFIKQCPPSRKKPRYPTQSWSDTLDQLMRQSLSDYPGAWMGTPGAQQDDWGLSLLKRLFHEETDVQDKAASLCTVLLSTPSALECLGPLPRGILWVGQQLAQADQNAALGKTPPIMRPDGDWVQRLIEQKVELTTPQGQAALALVKKTQLQKLAKTSSPAPSRHM